MSLDELAQNVDDLRVQRAFSRSHYDIGARLGNREYTIRVSGDAVRASNADMLNIAASSLLKRVRRDLNASDA